MTCRFSALTDVVCKGSALLRTSQEHVISFTRARTGRRLKVHDALGLARTRMLEAMWHYSRTYRLEPHLQEQDTPAMTAQHPVMGAPGHFIQITQQHDVGHGSGQIRAQHKGLVALWQSPLWMPSQRPLHGVQSSSHSRSKIQRRLAN